jgi:predicted nucleic acid-binding protein
VSRHLVLDASAAIEAVLRRPRAEAIIDRLEQAARVTVPDLYFAEVANALWKYVAAGDITIDDGQELLATASALADDSLASNDLATEALATAAAFDHPVYDALYAVAARRSGAAVCTVDRRLGSLLKAMRVPSITP